MPSCRGRGTNSFHCLVRQAGGAEPEREYDNGPIPAPMMICHGFANPVILTLRSHHRLYLVNSGLRELLLVLEKRSQDSYQEQISVLGIGRYHFQLQ